MSWRVRSRISWPRHRGGRDERTPAIGWFWQLRMKKRTSNRLVLATTHEETDKARTLRTKHGPLGCRAGIALARGRYRRVLNDGQIGRASCGKECRSRCAPKHEI